MNKTAAIVGRMVVEELMNYRRISVFALSVLMISQISLMRASAQEPVVYNEIIVRVNTDIITLAGYERNKAELESELKQKNLPPDKLKEEHDKVIGDLLQSMIDERLLSQKARELDIDVDAQVNEEWIQFTKTINSILCANSKMR